MTFCNSAGITMSRTFPEMMSTPHPGGLFLDIGLDLLIQLIATQGHLPYR